MNTSLRIITVANVMCKMTLTLRGLAFLAELQGLCPEEISMSVFFDIDWYHFIKQSGSLEHLLGVA